MYMVPLANMVLAHTYANRNRLIDGSMPHVAFCFLWD